MSRSPTQTALLHAYRHGTPYAHAEGPLALLVLHGECNPLTGEHRGQVLTRMCSSAAMARRVAAYALHALVVFPEHDPLAVSALYAEAAWRHACRRRGRLAA